MWLRSARKHLIRKCLGSKWEVFWSFKTILGWIFGNFRTIFVYPKIFNINLTLWNYGTNHETTRLKIAFLFSKIRCYFEPKIWYFHWYLSIVDSFDVTKGVLLLKNPRENTCTGHVNMLCHFKTSSTKTTREICFATNDLIWKNQVVFQFVYANIIEANFKGTCVNIRITDSVNLISIWEMFAQHVDLL